MTNMKGIGGVKETTNDDPSKIGTGAIKYDAGKPAVWQGAIAYFPKALEAVANVSAFGASKYQWAGWRSVEDGPNRYSNAMLRHLLSYAKGEDVAEDSNLTHLAHAAWNALAILELSIVQQEAS